MLKRLSFGLILGLCGMGLLGNGLYMGGKAKLAQNLPDRAWTKTAMTGDVHLPWS